MSVTAGWYGLGLKALANKEVDLDTDTIRCALLGSYTVDQDTHDYWSDISASEITGVGYVTKGASLTGMTLAYTGSTNTLMWDADDVVWATSTITASRAVYFLDTGTASTSALLVYVDFGGAVTSTAGNFTVTHNVAGIATITACPIA
jgi:hypothetical protein